MSMLERKGEKPLDANVELSPIAERVNLLKAQKNPWFYLQKGNLIWVERENHYDVYELTESWDKNKATEETFIDNICREANP